MTANKNLVEANQLRERELDPFPLEGTKLTPLRERVRLCPGASEIECEDEVDSLDPNQELCPSCQRIEDEMYHRRQLEAEGILETPYYEHLTDEGEL